MLRSHSPFTLALFAFLPLAAACSSTTSGTTTGGEGGSGGADTTSAGGSTATGTGGGTGGNTPAECGPDISNPDAVVPGSSDPEAGDFTMDEALAGLPEGPGPLRAIITTDLGTLTCELFADKVPRAVANFVGLARGTRPWKDPKTGEWVKRRFYDGLTFHRVIPEFMAQGGDPKGNGTGGPGYKFNDEIVAELKHEPGTLAYANSGKNTNGSQFYVTEIATDWLDGGYTIFGHCEPVDVVVKLTGVERDANDKPLEDLHMQKVEITRCAP